MASAVCAEIPLKTKQQTLESRKYVLGVSPCQNGEWQVGSHFEFLLGCTEYELQKPHTYGRRAFSVAGPTVWNSLPDFIRDFIRDPTISGNCFRRLLKTYLFVRY